MWVFSHALIACFCSYDLDLVSMTLTYELRPGIVKMYQHTKNEVSGSKFSRHTHRDRQTETQRETQTDATETITTPHSQWLKQQQQQQQQQLWLNVRYVTFFFGLYGSIWFLLVQSGSVLVGWHWANSLSVYMFSYCGWIHNIGQADQQRWIRWC